MKSILVVLGVACLLMTSGLAAEKAIEPKETITLFNGKDLAGWTLHVRGDGDAAKTFSVTDGVIACTGRPPGYMRTEKAYKNYKFTIEWRFLKKGNSGILVHMSTPDKVWPKSVECQGMFHNQGDFFVIGGTDFKEHTNKTSRRVLNKHKDNEKPIGEWNTMEAVCKGDTIRLWVNGLLQNEATETTVTEGRIGLQSEGTPIEFRSIMLEPLK